MLVCRKVCVEILQNSTTQTPKLKDQKKEPLRNPLVSPMKEWVHIGGGVHRLDRLGGLGRSPSGTLRLFPRITVAPLEELRDALPVWGSLGSAWKNGLYLDLYLMCCSDNKKKIEVADSQTLRQSDPKSRHSDSQTQKADNQTVRQSDLKSRQSDTQTVRPGRQTVRHSDSQTRHADSQTVRHSDLAKQTV